MRKILVMSLLVTLFLLSSCSGSVNKSNLEIDQSNKDINNIVDEAIKIKSDIKKEIKKKDPVAAELESMSDKARKADFKVTYFDYIRKKDGVVEPAQEKIKKMDYSYYKKGSKFREEDHTIQYGTEYYRQDYYDFEKVEHTYCSISEYEPTCDLKKYDTRKSYM